MKWPEDFVCKLITGDCLDVMRGMDAESIQCCITSPPYWGLRDYGLRAKLWGGDDGCEHEWGNAQVKSIELQCRNPEFQRKWREQATAETSGSGRFCQLCGAWLGSLGLEPSPELYVDHLVEIFREVKRVLRKDGTLWLNIGDSYAGGGRGANPADSRHKKQATNVGSLVAPTPIPNGLKPKNMVLIPFRLALALQADGWCVRSDIIWHKPNCMPSSAKDRPTTDYEHVFLLAKSKKYYYDQDAIREPQTGNTHPKGSKVRPPKEALGAKGGIGHEGWSKSTSKYVEAAGGRNKRCVWTIPSQPYPEAHFATYPEKLIEPMILAGSREGDIVLDPFAGSGTTCAVAKKEGRRWIGIEMNPDYCKLARARILEAERQMLLNIVG